MVLTVVAFRKWKTSERGRGQWDAFRLRIPAKIGDIVQEIALARWSRTLSALISAGVPLPAALEITGKTAGNHVVEKDSPAFPGMVTHMIGVGEEQHSTGRSPGAYA